MKHRHFTDFAFLCGSLSLTATLLLGASCSDDTNTDDGQQELAPQAEFEPTSLDFGQLLVEDTQTLMVTLRNSGSVPAVFKQFEVPPMFVFENLKGGEVNIPPNESTRFAVRFKPTAVGLAQGNIVAIGPQLRIELPVRGTGLERPPEPTALLSLTPERLDFGSIEVGETTSAKFSLRNSGEAAGTIESASFEMSRDFSLVQTLPVTIAAGETLEFELIFAPKTRGKHTATLTLHAVEQPAQLVVLNGEAFVPKGRLECDQAAIDFGAVERLTIVPQNVICTAKDGEVEVKSATITTSSGRNYFMLVPPPAAQLLAENSWISIPLEFRAEGASVGYNGTLEINYAGLGGNGTQRIPLTAQMIPPTLEQADFSIQVDWFGLSNLDLHLVRNNGVLFSASDDCSYVAPTQDWGVLGETLDDPQLSEDVLIGTGSGNPEVINLLIAPNGTYDIYVHFNSILAATQIPTIATFGMRFKGVDQGSAIRVDMSCDNLWHVGRITWIGTDPTFEFFDLLATEPTENVPDFTRAERCPE